MSIFPASDLLSGGARVCILHLSPPAAASPRAGGAAAPQPYNGGRSIVPRDDLRDTDPAGAARAGFLLSTPQPLGERLAAPLQGGAP
jgi:hypothetical protein